MKGEGGIYTPYVEHSTSVLTNPKAIVKAARLVQALEGWATAYEQRYAREYSSGLVVPKANIGAIRGGLPFIPEVSVGVCSVYLDVRLPPDQTPVKVQRELEQLAANLGFEVEIENYMFREGHEGKDVGNFVSLIEKSCEEEIHRKPGKIHTPITSMWRDCNVFNEVGIPSVTFGPRTGGNKFPSPAPNYLAKEPYNQSQKNSRKLTQTQGFGRPRSRIETLVDLIFGLSLSIGAISLITGSPPANDAEINSRILAFIFTFSFLITSWMVFTYQMSVLPIETRLVTALNVVLLMLIAIIPFLLFNVVFVNQTLTPNNSDMIRDYSSFLFAIDLAGVLGILATFSHVISIEEKKLVAPEIAARFKQSRNVQAGLSIIMLISLLPQLWDWTFLNVPIRLYVWLIPIIVYWVRRFRQGQ